MAVLGTSKLRWKYTSDKAVVYQVSAEADLVSQTKQGGAAADGTEPQLPRGFRMRRAYVAAGDVGRSVPCYTTAAALWTTPGTHINLMKNSVSTDFTNTGVVLSERANFRRVTHQDT